MVAFLCGLVGAQYDYSGALSKSVLFFEAQRSGKLPATNRIPWRGDAFVVDGSDRGLDLSGGYHDGIIAYFFKMVKNKLEFSAIPLF